MIGVELVDPEGPPQPTPDGPTPEGPRPAAPELAAAVQRECLSRGLIVELGGRRSSVVRLLPPLTISDEQASAVLDRLADAVSAVSATAMGDRRPGRDGTRGADGPE
jgi:diaminobutyrate-2-oxoglutarate transaminase